jgi:glycyl-tRNA synthetase beta chain
MLPEAIGTLRKALEQGLDEIGITFESVTTQGTPRRLAAIVDGLAARQNDVEEELRGPPADRAFDAQGKPTKAAQGFARRCGVPVEQLQRLETPKGVYLAHKDIHPGQPTATVLPELLGRILSGFPWPKSMRWGASRETRFVRPIQSLLVLLDGQVLPLTVQAEDPPCAVRSGQTVLGHRFLSPGQHPVANGSDYVAVLRRAHVLLSLEERVHRIQTGLKEQAAILGGRVLEDAALLSENACLTEWPVAIAGRFSPEFLEIPPEVLTTSMKSHQKYFPVVNADNKLMPAFVAISNITVPDPSVLAQGYARVLRARLADAAFFWHEDRKTPLIQRRDALRQVVFQAQLGTLYQKSQRMARLAKVLAETLHPGQPDLAADAQLAAELCKCDLVTGMVGEFPELQGIMGGYYYRHTTEHARKTVAQAIREHYHPQGASDAIPITPTGRLVALADKLDTLTGCFGIGLTPTGTKDPFALRRAALGVIRIALDEQTPSLPLRSILQIAHAAYEPGVLTNTLAQTLEPLMAFFYGRLKAHLKADGYGHDLIDAVEALDLDDLADGVARVNALATFKSLPQFESLVQANKRIAHILEKATSDLSGLQIAAYGRINGADLDEPAEQALWEALEQTSGQVAAATQAGRYAEALEQLAGLRETIDAFFDTVLVNDPDPDKRMRRLALLGRVRETFHQVADVSRLVLSETG